MLVSIGLPVFNGEEVLEDTIRSILAQQYGDIELVISDNASTDSTEEICRALAAKDRRISYHRHPENRGLLRNFEFAIQAARGTFFRWIGDDDRLDPAYTTTCLAAFAADPRLLLVTTQIAYTDTRDGIVRTQSYDRAGIRTGINSDDPVERVTEVLRLLNEGYLVIDPLYGMVRRDAVLALGPRWNAPREDQVFAARLAMGGPWLHINEVLASRNWDIKPSAKLARRLGVPAWQAYCGTLLQCFHTMHWAKEEVAGGRLTRGQYKEIRTEVGRLYAHRMRNYAVRGLRKSVRQLTGHA